MVGTYQAAKQQGKYPPLSPTLRPKQYNVICVNILTKPILFLFGCSEVNSTWLITSDLANQHAQLTTIHQVEMASGGYLPSCKVAR